MLPDGDDSPDLEQGCTLSLESEVDAPRLDQFLSEVFSHISRSYIAKVIRAGGARVNGQLAKPAASVYIGDRVVLELPPLRPIDVTPQDIPLDILFEDDSVIVVNKQKGLAAHPAASCPENTLVNALLHHFGDSLSRIGGELRPGIVHRLDKDTSGVMIVARNNEAHQSLAAQFMARSVEKHYMAVVHGKMRQNAGTIDAPIGRHPKDRKRMAVVSKGGRDAISLWTLEKTYNYFSVLDVKLETGRTHQIRVHTAHIGHPVAGDKIYGGAKFKLGLKPDSPVRAAVQGALDALDGQALHARSLAFNHPRTGERMTIQAPLPGDISRFMDFLNSGGEAGEGA